ncbi:glycosyltransferase family 9 protein [Malaciobacter marinus]|uniref:glycosyltransferase family 9 protein n=1 Tax=Malaciobacter marinus TaxID=505249 RepID=UPI000C06A704|nr:glycosyltransferase family 9 protein [Malaciobacter marinus]PHO11325.1 hypothetical protein CPG38_13620 [Malaciobacter marinus]
MKLKQKIKNYFFKKIAQKNYHEKLSNIRINKILLIRDGGIGDAICSYPLIRELNKKYPNAKIDIYASLNNYFMYKYVPNVNKVYLKHKKRNWFKSWIEIYKMKKNKYDLAIEDTTIRFHRTLYTIIINPKFIIASSANKDRYGFDRSELSYYDKVYPSNDKIIHIVDKRLRALKLLGINTINNKMDFFLPNQKNNEIIKYLNRLKGYKLIALNTDASHKNRTLSVEQIINLCKLLNNDRIRIIPFCIPKKYDYFKKVIESNNLNNVVLPFKSKSIYEAAEILNNVDLLITPDTSFVHIASGLNIPTIGLFWNTPIKYVEWAPKSDIGLAITPKGKEHNLKYIDIEEIKDHSFKILNI